jgi:phage pi2 protein 07
MVSCKTTPPGGTKPYEPPGKRPGRTEEPTEKPVPTTEEEGEEGSVPSFIPDSKKFDYRVRWLEMKSGDPSLSKITDQFNREIKDVVQKTFDSALKSEQKDVNIYIIRFTLSRNKAVELSLKMDLFSNVNTAVPQFSHTFIFDFEEKNSLLDYIKNKLIGEYMFAKEGIKNDEIREKVELIDLTRTPAESIKVTIKPTIEVRDDGGIKWHKVENLNDKMEISGYEISEDYNNGEYRTGPYSINGKEFSGDYSSFSPEIQQYVDSIYPYIIVSVLGEQKPDWKEQNYLASTELDETVYRVRYSCKGSSSNNRIQNYSFEISGYVEREHIIKKLPEYDFAAGRITLTDNEITVSYQDDDIIVYNFNAFEIDELRNNNNDEKKLVKYIYINEEMAEFINKNNGNILFYPSDNFNVEFEIVKNTIRAGTVGAAIDSRERLDLLKELHKAVINSEKVTEIRKTYFNGLLCDELNEKIVTGLADWFVKITFNNELLWYDDAVIPLEGMVLSEREERLPLTLNAMNTIRITFEDIFDIESDTLSDRDLLDLTRIFFFLGNGKYGEKSAERIRNKETYNSIIKKLKNWNTSLRDSDLLVIKSRSTDENLFYLAPSGKVKLLLLKLLEADTYSFTKEDNRIIYETFGL